LPAVEHAYTRLAALPPARSVRRAPEAPLVMTASAPRPHLGLAGPAAPPLERVPAGPAAQAGPWVVDRQPVAPPTRPAGARFQRQPAPRAAACRPPRSTSGTRIR